MAERPRAVVSECSERSSGGVVLAVKGAIQRKMLVEQCASMRYAR